MDTYTTINGKPVSAQPSGMNEVTLGQASGEAAAAQLRAEGIDAKETPTGIVVDVHKLECGDVGQTGDHGKLGTNAK